MQELKMENVAVWSGENTGQDYYRTNYKEGCWQTIKEVTSQVFILRNIDIIEQANEWQATPCI